MPRILYQNKRALRQLTVTDRIEVGMQLWGWEVKSIKHNMFDLAGAYAMVTPKGELMIRGMRVASWKTGMDQPDILQKRERKLLAHTREIEKIRDFASRPGYTVVPESVYINNKGRIKIQIAIAKGRKRFESKQVAKEKDVKRQMQKDLRNVSL